jgi:hypothetical protein
MQGTSGNAVVVMHLIILMYDAYISVGKWLPQVQCLNV